MKKLAALLSMVVLIGAIFSGCVSIFGTYKKVHIRSTPSGASIYRDDGKYIGQTPFLYKGKAHNNFYLSMNGYEDAGIYTDSKFNPLYLANIIRIDTGLPPTSTTIAAFAPVCAILSATLSAPFLHEHFILSSLSVKGDNHLT